MALDATRRELLAALAALAVAPAGGAAPSSLRAALETVASAGDQEGMLALLRRTPKGGLDPQELALLGMVARGLERDIELRRAFPFGKPDGSSPYVLSHRHGAWLQLDPAGSSPADQARRLDSETERLRSEARRGLAPPGFILDSVLEAQLALRGKAPRELGAALDRQMAELRRLRSGAVSAPGAWRLPGGEDYYRLRLRCTTGLDDSPAQLERRVAAETSALLRRADRLLKPLGLASGSIGERLRALKRRPEQSFSNDEAGRTRAVAAMNAALGRVRPYLGAWFDPPFATGASVRRMTAADELAGRRGYRDPAAGAYYPDVAAVGERPGWTLATVAFHETIPGHLLQAVRQARSDPHPLQVKYAPGYPEGWAIYAETLADDRGLLTPVEQLGFIQSLLFRLARVTCDIGIHLRRWDRARAVSYLEETVGFELFFPFAVEVDRYAVEPGAFAGDAMVALTLREPGRKAAASGGLRGFHDAVLDRGPMSAETIERVA
jgi:uncharacterized protein (DUF885 family)